MDQESFCSYVKAAKIGKKLPDAIYIHKSSLKESVGTQFETFISRVAVALKIENSEWDIVKLFRKSFRLALLSYPDFFEDSYPSLRKSTLVDLANLTHRVTDYGDSTNPPILHRKETMISPGHSYSELFREITAEGEAAGLYDNPHSIGFKNSWARRIEAAGLMLQDGRLVKDNSASSTVQTSNGIDRHKTAIVRHQLSAPMKSLAKHGYLDGNYTLFDYGCGRGDDLTELGAHGIDASGWDPAYLPDAELTQSDLVNIGFVLNVIEDIDERVEALATAFSLSDKLLVVSAMLANENYLAQFKPYKDGVITSRNTFQKYYSQAELQGFIERTLDENAIAVAPGIFYVFKDKDEEQQFLSKRSERNVQWNQLTTRSSLSEEKMKHLFIQHGPLLESFWIRCLQLGRIPANDEFEQSEKLRTAVGSHNKALRILEHVAETSELQIAADYKRDDRLVYFALSMFNKRKAYARLPEQLKRDTKVFFGSYKLVMEEAKELLFSIADEVQINEACRKAHAELPASYLDESHSLTFHEKFLEALPKILRVYVGCAAQLYGELDDVSLIKIHIRSGKVTFMVYEDFESKPIPMLKERIKVKLREQDVDFFDYVDDYSPQPLYQKSRFLDDSFDDYSKQRTFDKKLEKLDVLASNSEYGPDLDELQLRLKQQGMTIKGYRFYKMAES
ncbi:DNA phosphorothioation-associated putative methyltransferase [Paraferrimonas sedimenticola]|uniref:DNA phosphorothioation-associated methyltransferase n=1 Tax=Paraferrimonas sedimenticola TaxID=375674 RepID=A0AA37RYL4_9GAMM|nr:DNA phosphorothioation-associated putative methyltransferase [Paraferrimonas sedimenticola]GLP96997.1 hypothetical protein GCM10007895_23030 [Paraferrimonas sedimenticola]